MSKLTQYYDYERGGLNPDLSVAGSDDLLLDIIRTLHSLDLGKESMLYSYELKLSYTDNPNNKMLMNGDLSSIFRTISENESQGKSKNKSSVIYDDKDKSIHANDNLYKFLRLASQKEHMDGNDFYHFARNVVKLIDDANGTTFAKDKSYMPYEINTIFNQRNIPYRVINVPNPDDSTGNKLLLKLIPYEGKVYDIEYSAEVKMIKDLLDVYVGLYTCYIDYSDFETFKNQFKSLYNRIIIFNKSESAEHTDEKILSESEMSNIDNINNIIQKLGLNYMIECHSGSNTMSYKIVKLAES